MTRLIRQNPSIHETQFHASPRIPELEEEPPRKQVILVGMRSSDHGSGEGNSSISLHSLRFTAALATGVQVVHVNVERLVVGGFAIIVVGDVEHEHFTDQTSVLQGVCPVDVRLAPSPGHGGNAIVVRSGDRRSLHGKDVVQTAAERDPIESENVPLSGQRRKVLDESGHDTQGLHGLVILSISDRLLSA
jgi:hypothetical protein